MPEKDGFEKFFGEKITSEDPFSMNTKKEQSDESQDSEEEIIELTDPDDAPVAETEEEIIEPADFLEDLSMDEPALSDQQGSNTLSSGDDDDIIELTDAVEEPSTAEQKLNEILPSDDSIHEDKDLFVFTDSEDEAIIADDDILSDTVFADEPSKEHDPQEQQPDQEPVILSREEEEKQELQDGRMFDDTVFADERSGNDDDELAVLTEIDESTPQTEKGMFDDTVLGGETLRNEDEELAVLTEPQGKPMDSDALPDTADDGITPSSDGESDMILLDDTDTDVSDTEEPFIESDILDSRKSEPTETERLTDQDIADSLGMNLEQDIGIPGNTKSDDSIEMTIEPEPEMIHLEPDPPIPEIPATDKPDITQADEPIQSGPMESTAPIPPDQLEAAVEKVIRKMFGDKIDGMIIDVIEKTVQADIEKIKKELLKISMEDD